VAADKGFEKAEQDLAKYKLNMTADEISGLSASALALGSLSLDKEASPLIG
jgi:hypothetical protein